MVGLEEAATTTEGDVLKGYLKALLKEQEETLLKYIGGLSLENPDYFQKYWSSGNNVAAIGFGWEKSGESEEDIFSRLSPEQKGSTYVWIHKPSEIEEDLDI